MPIDRLDENRARVTFPPPAKGAWTHSSAASAPDGFAPTLTNIDLLGGIPSSMPGNAAFLDAAYPSATMALFTQRRTTTATTYVCAVHDNDTSLGQVLYWTGSAWANLRTGLTSSQTSLWWSERQYGTDLFITNEYDGIYRYDGTTLIPIGAKTIATSESSEAALWTNETADTTNYKEGVQSVKVTSGNPGASSVLTYTPAATLDIKTGRLQAADYAVSKSPGTDFYHFWVKFSAGSTSTITAATTTFVVTDTAAKTLTWAASLWRSAKTSSAAAISLTSDAWQEVWCYAADATEVATFDPTLVASFKWTVTTSASQTDMSIDDIYVVYANTMPNVQYLAEWKNVLFGARTTANPDTVYFSKQAGPDEYATTANFPLKTKGDAITGIKNFFNQLVIGADHSTHTISSSIAGSTYPDYIFDTQQVSDENGVSSHRSMVKANNNLYWLYQKDFVKYTGVAITKVSYPVDVTLRSLDEANLALTVGDLHKVKNQIVWTYRRTDQSANDRLIRYDYINDAWLPCEGVSTPLVKRIFASGVERCCTINTTTRKVQRFYVSGDSSPAYTFDGTNITYTWLFPPVVLDEPMQWEGAYISYLTNTGAITIAYRVADHLRALSGASYTTAETITQSAAGELGNVRLGDFGSCFQLRITATAVLFEIQPPVVVYARRLTDGDKNL